MYAVTDSGDVTMVRRAESVDDVLAMQIWPDREEKKKASGE